MAVPFETIVVQSYPEGLSQYYSVVWSLSLLSALPVPLTQGHEEYCLEGKRMRCFPNSADHQVKVFFFSFCANE